MSDEVRDLRRRMKEFIDEVVFKAEPELERHAERGFDPETGLPVELYEAAQVRGDEPVIPAVERDHGRPQGGGQGPGAVGPGASA